MGELSLSLLGNVAMYVAVIAAAVAVGAGIAAGRSGSPRLLNVARSANLLVFGALSCAAAVLVYAFVTHDFTLKYVHQHSDKEMPLFYTVTAWWGGMEGSLLFWAWILSIYAVAAVTLSWQRHKPLMPWMIATLQTIVIFFVLVIVHLSNPFARFLVDAPDNGAGLNPLLQNYYMVFHPPMLYLGYVGFSVPFAFGVAALISGRLDEFWLRSIRRWTLIPWFFLLTGLTLGGLWAYEELGWGGYWAWDPVENAAFMPWLTGTALIHSVMLQERRGMLKVWNVSLVMLSFILTILGTYLTRSGVVQSVHSFAKSDIGIYFFGFIIALIAFCALLVIWRLPRLHSRGQMESLASRDFVFLLNNWILLGAAFFVLFGTMWPTISEAIWNERVTVGPPFFNKWMVPIGIVLLFLTGVGPLLSWRRTTRATLIHQFTWPGVWLLIVGVAAFFCARWLENPEIPAAAGEKWFAIACLALCGFVASCLFQEYSRGTRVRMENRGTGVAPALVGLVARNKRRYGGYLVHFGLVIMFCGFAGNAFNTSTEVVMQTDQETMFAGHRLRFRGVKYEKDPQKQMYTATLERLSNEGEILDTFHPATWAYEKRGSASAMDATTHELSIRRGPREDLYLVLGDLSGDLKQAKIQILIRPLTSWVWLGYLIVLCGTIVVLAPDRKVKSTAEVGAPSLASAGSQVLAGAILMFLLFWPGTAQAQERCDPPPVDANTAVHTPRSSLERSLLPLLRCMCGGCNYNLADCVCGHAVHEREVFDVLEDGMRGSPDPTAYTDRFIKALESRAKLPGDPGAALAAAKEVSSVGAGAASPTYSEEVLREAMTQLFIKRFGGMDVLTAPVDRGIQRLAWAVPYAAIVAGMAVVFLLAMRWVRGSRRLAAAGRPVSKEPLDQVEERAPALVGADRERLKRLEDELAQIE